ncbi:uncharacterized protein LOC143853785 [Tasmannia lanceolata]|uniref:uncharacterized protein LOC143853785 n=1 Tax=Tasmannia lanceolata TaxID=3420 RepID=UPI0040646626
MAARKLRPYFQAHTIKVLIDQPLRQVLHRPNISGRLVKWAMELSEFDIQYVPRPAIKAQVLADFVAECTIPQQITDSEVVPTPVVEKSITTEGRTEEGTEAEIISAPAEEDPSTAELIWEVYVDGSSNKGGCGAGLILTGPDNFTADYALRFGFRASNNEAEYEALLAGMSLAIQTSAQRLKAYCDSQLDANQIQGNSSIESKAAEVMQVENESCWMDEIVEYLRGGKLPEAKKEASKVVQRAARFSLSGENLYKRSYTLPYLKCLWPGDAAYTLQETHEGICGEYLGGKALTIKVLLREAVIPVDVGTPSPRVTSFNEQLNGDGLRANLDLLEEAREESRIRVAAYKQKVSNYHDSKIRPKEFRTGDLVLRKAAVSQPTKVRKLSSTWEGPYRVKEVIRPGSYKLETLEEHILSHAWNSKNLRKYYQ